MLRESIVLTQGENAGLLPLVHSRQSSRLANLSMNNNHRPKIISGIITIKEAAITREAFVLHKVLFYDHRKHDGRSQPSPEIPILPNLCQGMVMDQQNIKTYTRG